MYQLFRLLQRTLLVSGLLIAAVQHVYAADGGISLSRTRIIFTSADKAQTLSMKNNGPRPYLVQSAIITAPDSRELAPFISTPPLFRLEANSQSAIRILRSGDAALPVDRESVFYFTAIAVPATDKPNQGHDATMSARLSVGIQNTIKLFYRPVGLAMTAEEAGGKLTFQQQNGKIQVNNPTPYYLTFSRLAFDGTDVNVREGVSMIAPFSQATYPAKGMVRQAQWSVINDYGGSSKLYQSAVQGGGK
ncbi:molecular chaperone [Klebsiella pneumoniae]|uniref:fimbrial biogenesis chaperone n=1 Tax=Klebsiella pneumoniae TaxID=573 RepID=UPI000CB88D49|nr:molecular chaperone [Klebsiella pneumoniae]AZQ28175.1 molecular chaperone [Klebsiella pneumoniae]EIX9102982.1 molecular chaperone [Klebsiella pneumoniae]EIX9513889.1 molecular chaperone [Klebsiella pneumoniae]MBX4830246.1 molecular chaperone [Klebsiella pneumoniae]MCG5591081.1 molecular chaperone [Klebsiella pneumoniae]